MLLEQKIAVVKQQQQQLVAIMLSPFTIADPLPDMTFDLQGQLLVFNYNCNNSMCNHYSLPIAITAPLIYVE